MRWWNGLADSAAGEASDERSRTLEVRAPPLASAALRRSLSRSLRSLDRKRRHAGEEGMCAEDTSEHDDDATAAAIQPGLLALSHSRQTESGTRLLSRPIATIEQTMGMK